MDRDPVFLSAFMVQLGGTKRGAFGWYCRRNGLDPARQDDGGLDNDPLAAVLAKRGFKNFVLYVKTAPPAPDAVTVATLAHEAFHGACHVMNCAGIDPAADASDEATAYYIGFVVREVYARLWPPPAARKARRRKAGKG